MDVTTPDLNHPVLHPTKARYEIIRTLASFGARTYPGTKRMYGTSGNSFVAVVEFGDKVRARAVTAGGQSGNPSSPHFNDQATRYSTGDLREVYFYKEDVDRHAERRYHPGYYAAFVLDPDGNNIEAVYHGKAQRSAASVKITF